MQLNDVELSLLRVESGERYIGGPPPSPTTYTRILSFGLVVHWERIELDSDARATRIQRYCWIAIQPLKQLSALARDLLSDR